MVSLLVIRFPPMWSTDRKSSFPSDHDSTSILNDSSLYRITDHHIIPPTTLSAHQHIIIVDVFFDP